MEDHLALADIVIERVFAPLADIMRIEHQLVVVAQGYRDERKAVDGHIQHGAAVLVAIRRQIGAAARQAEPERRSGSNNPLGGCHR